MRITNVLNKAKRKQQLQQHTLENIKEVKLTPDDMNDPELLAELQMLQGAGGKGESGKKVDISKLQADMKAYQIKAVKARRGGDLKLAKKYFLEYKRIKQLIEGYGKKC